MVVIAIALLAALLAHAPGLDQHPETLSLLGEPLYAPPLDKKDREEADAAYARARAGYGQHPGDRDAVLGLARASLALGRVGDALEVLTRGLEARPEDPALLAERGRGYILIRKFAVAERDLRKAAGSLADARCPLALAIYLAGDFTRARQAYGSCPDPGAFGSLAERRAGATAAAAPAPAEPAARTPPLRFPGTVSSAKEAARPIGARYQAAVEQLLAGHEDGARDALKAIVEKDRRGGWMDPAYIAAEADYARLYKATRPKKKKK
jgi:thioredoxin-like negative regulator of GroEL